MGVRAALIEIRGDRKFLKEAFHLPGWSGAGAICWRCVATRDDLRPVGPDARWRHERRDHWGVVSMILNSGEALSPMFAIPWMTTAAFRIVWLRAVDQGVGADLTGNFFKFLIEAGPLPGATHKARCTSLWREIQSFYAAHDVHDKLQTLTSGMVCAPRASPKLRASAAQARALVPFFGCKEAAEKFCDPSPIGQAVKAAAASL